MTNANATTTTLKFHRRDRTATLVGTLKNGHGIYRVSTVTATSGSSYNVRRASFNESSKGHAKGKGISCQEIVRATFTCSDAYEQARGQLQHELSRKEGSYWYSAKIVRECAPHFNAFVARHSTGEAAPTATKTATIRSLGQAPDGLGEFVDFDFDPR